MPVLWRSPNNSKIRLVMKPDDHAPPHCHLEGPDWEAWINLRTLEVELGWAPAGALTEALDHIRDNTDFFLERWRVIVERE
jgi:hypothetical protein